MKEIQVKRFYHFNIIRSEMTKEGQLIGGRLIAGDSEYTSFDEALEKATDTIDLALGAIKMRSLVNKHNGRKRHDYRKVLEAIITRDKK